MALSLDRMSTARPSPMDRLQVGARPDSGWSTRGRDRDAARPCPSSRHRRRNAMDQVVASSAPATSTPQHHHTLRRDALGLPQVLFCIVTGAAPLAAMMFNVPIAVLGGGYSAPLAFLIATVALTVFSVGYIEMARRVTSTGGFYTFVSRGLGSVAGLGTGVLIAACYLIFTAAVTGVLGYFASTTIDDWTGANIPAWVYMFVALGIMMALAFFHIE